jgi:hypothetical protein
MLPCNWTSPFIHARQDGAGNRFPDTSASSHGKASRRGTCRKRVGVAQSPRVRSIAGKMKREEEAKAALGGEALPSQLARTLRRKSFEVSAVWVMLRQNLAAFGGIRERKAIAF